MTASSQFLLSADFDGKIRVSHYPKAFVIESFCLGHKSFVNTVFYVIILYDYFNGFIVFLFFIIQMCFSSERNPILVSGVFFSFDPLLLSLHLSLP